MGFWGCRRANGEEERVSQQASPRGTFLKIADSVKVLIEGDPEMTELPSLTEVMREHGSRSRSARPRRRRPKI